MKTVNKPLENMGGLIKIWALPLNSFYVSGKTLTFLNIVDVFEIYCSEDTMNHECPSQRTMAGLSYNTIVSGFSPGDSEENIAHFEEMNGKKFAVLFINGDGEFRLVGDAFAPLRFFADFNSGTTTKDRAGYNIRFTGITLTPPVALDNPFIS